MTIERNKMVTLTYDLRLGGAEGELIESATTEQPLKFLYGSGLMIPKFEQLLEGKAEGEDFHINLTSDEAYGQRDETAVVDIPKDVFIVDGKFDEELIAVGNHVPMMSQGGQRMNGLVLFIDDNNVKMDFNHPLAGENLNFQGAIIEVRDATDEEIAAVTNPEGGCGGGCDCDSDCSTDGKEGGCGCN